MDLEEFIKVEKGNTRANNRLKIYKDDISKMRAEGLSYKSIQKYLALKDISISIQAISKFVRTYIETKESKLHKVGFVKKGEEVVSKPQQTNAQPSSKSVPPSWAANKNIDDII